LPDNAILLLSSFSSSHATYEAIGEEAWRGILPDTPENRARISTTSSGELSKTPPGKELPKATARQIAQQVLADHANYTGYSGKYKFSVIQRRPFGWFFGVNVLDERGEISFVRDLTIQVNDEGEVVSYRNSMFGSSWSASEWDAIPNL
jgi:hypothetical protein